jgi:hypothetical protein
VSGDWKVPLARIACALAALSCLSFSALPAAAQDPVPQTGPRTGFEINPNYPNPFNPETTVRFTLNDELFTGGQAVVVTARIFNVLSQPVAYPVALGHPAGAVEVRSLEYGQPGLHEAFWDGTDQSGRQVASGIYLLQITVNGQSKTMKMIVQK